MSSARFGKQTDHYREGVWERVLLELEQALSLTPEVYDAPLRELNDLLLGLLAPSSLHPQDAGNALFTLEKAYQDGVAELEMAGCRTEGLTVYEFIHRLEHLGKVRQAAKD